ncbi:DUF2789 domain-containing protein [Pseudomonas sp. 5P_3.1_Bac2]|uniref:DUF2789 domain-containing protein n=1 Tax=Pseudomonas sp. 5P_3.1_Bac2 TaxID=2971617 RepID=UPI0021C8EE8D|nr:DUF2789 domain-containing protein [Pseudomonas sp. 5P_3.1_Bac2]MCU1718417.1 DUF2789 domain-containing protein [Pseudomonas sp. 5P_3.1_Bac2]
MSSYPPDLVALFQQLGLPSDPASIESFIKHNGHLAPDEHLADASFWQPEQAKFLRDKLLQDADWADSIDQLNLLLRA